MRTSKKKASVLPKNLKNAYWRTVINSLVEFHGISKAEARTRVRRLREGYEDLWYNTEEFDVANRIANAELDWGSHRDEYFAMKDREYANVRVGNNGRD